MRRRDPLGAKVAARVAAGHAALARSPSDPPTVRAIVASPLADVRALRGE